MGSALKLETFGIGLTSEKVIEFSGNRPAITIKLNEISRLELRYGLPAERPWLGALFSMVLVALGVFGVVRSILTLIQDHAFFLPFLAMVPFAVIGSWMFYQSFRRNYFLNLETTRGRRKLNFSKRLDPKDAQQFVEEWNQQSGDLKCEWMEMPGR